MDVIIHAGTLLYSVHVRTLLYTYGRYCTRTDAIVHVRTLLYTYGSCTMSQWML